MLGIGSNQVTRNSINLALQTPHRTHHLWLFAEDLQSESHIRSLGTRHQRWRWPIVSERTFIHLLYHGLGGLGIDPLIVFAGELVLFWGVSAAPMLRVAQVWA